MFFRNTTVELETNLWPEALRLYEQFLKYPNNHPKSGKFIGKAHINYQKHTITFPSGAKSVFTYMQQDKDADSWYGAEISRAYFDEFQRQKEYCFDIIRSRLRSKAKVKSCARMTLNPDSTHFVYNYVEPYLTEEGYPDPQHECKVRYFVMVQGILHSSWDRQDLLDKFPDKIPKTYCYVPSTIEDNKILQEMEKDYKDSLDSLPEAKRKQLLLGCWHNVDNSCMYFNREYMSVQERIPQNAKRVRAWDLAGTEFDPNAPAGSYARNPDYTVGVLMSKFSNDTINETLTYCVEDVVRDRLSSAKVEELIIETAAKDREYYGDDVIIYLPTDPNPAAERYIKGLISKLVSLGFRATTSKTNKAKVDRFIPVAIANENKLMTYIQGEWNKEYFAELEKFTGIKREMNRSNAFDDQVDATADAFETLNKHRILKPFGIPDCSSATTRVSEYKSSIR